MASADEKSRKQTERLEMRKLLLAFRNAKCDPIKIVDEDTLPMRHGLVINRTIMAGTYQGQIYPAKREKPRLHNAVVKPENPAESQMVVRITVLDKCFIDYRKHLCENSIKWIKFLGTAESVLNGADPCQPAPLRHPSLVRVFDTFVTDKKAYIFMEQLPSSPLSAKIKFGDGLTLAETQDIARQVSDALLFLSRRYLAHLNVRADNFLLDSKKQVKLVGLSRLFLYWDSDRDQKAMHKSINEKNYMDHFPPEVCKEDVDFDPSLIDSFSFGVLLHQMLTREKPFIKWQPYKGDEDMQQLWKEHCIENKDLMKPISPLMLNLLERMLASKPQDRPSIEQVVKDDFFTAKDQSSGKQ